MQPIPDIFLPQDRFQVTDPKDTNVRAPGDNPDGLPGGGGGGGSPAVGRCGCGCSCRDPEAGRGQDSAGGESPSEDTFPFAHLRGQTGYLIVRMRPEYLPDPKRVWKEASLLELAQQHDLDGLTYALTAPLEDVDPSNDGSTPTLGRGIDLEACVTSRPLVFNTWLDRLVCPGVSWARETLYERLGRLEARSRTTPFAVRHSLMTYWRVDCRRCSHLMEVLLERLAGLAEVDLVYRELPALDPSSDTGGGPRALYAEAQSYLDEAPVGIGSRAVRPLLGEVQRKVRCVDLEQQWTLDHRDLKTSEGQRVPGPHFGANRGEKDMDGHHGTAVLALLGGGLDDKIQVGVGGVADPATDLSVTSHYVDRWELSLRNGETQTLKVDSNGHVAEAIAHALSREPSRRKSGDLLNPLGRGDILLLEVQRGYLPAEADHADFDAIRLAASQGVLVVEAAGNGGLDLDAYVDETGRRPFARQTREFQDSGAVLVGAARPEVPHPRAEFSNFGARVDCYGWGEDVTTAGYGDLIVSQRSQDLYTNTFRGTSSAAPMVAGAAILLITFYRQLHGDERAPSPRRLRRLLSDPRTGTPQGPSVPGAIGVMPNLQAIMGHEEVALLPSLYMRRSVDPACRDVLGTSPDIFLWHQQSLREDIPNHLFLFDVPPLQGQLEYIQARISNRGAIAAAPNSWHLDVYSGPAASMVSPHRWSYRGTTRDPQRSVPKGDVPQMVPPLQWVPPNTEALSSVSLLAVLSTERQPPRRAELLIESRCVDWQGFLDFFAEDRVVCRNVQDIAVQATDLSTPFEFFLAGAFDRRRRFDFEIVQRLPRGWRWRWETATHLATLLMQRRSWQQEGAELPGSPQPELSFDLPAAPRLALRDVPLNGGAHLAVRAQLLRDSSAESLGVGHGLAIRQLWQGREVGRITWRLWPSETRQGLEG